MMFSYRLRAVCALLVLVLALAVRPASAQTFTNPIATGLNPGVADPFITYQNGNYYLTGTSTSGSITIYASPSLATLGSSTPHYVYNVGHFFESAELYPFNGLWYIYYTNGLSGITVIESDTNNPLGTYHFKANLTTDLYDATVLTMPGGGLYLVASGLNNIVIQAMSNPYTLTGGRTVICNADQAWEHGVTEAPNWVWHSGQLDVMYSGGNYNTSNYGMGLLRFNGGNPLTASNWVKLAGPIFTQYPSYGVYDVGVASPFSSPDGTQTYMVFGDYNTGVSNPPDPNRCVFVQPLTFDYNNNPVMGTPVAPGWGIAVPPGDPAGPASVLNTGIYYRILDENSGKVIAVSGQSKQAGAQLTQWDDNGTPDHNWKLVPLGNGYYHIVNQNSGMLMAVNGASTADSADVTQWTDNGTPDHNWKLESIGGGYYHIVNQNSQKLLAVQGGSTANGAFIQQYHDNGTRDHNWVLIPVGASNTAIVPGAFYTLTNASSGLNLDDPGGSNQNGTALQQWTPNNATAQNWQLNQNPDGSFTLTNQAGGINADDPNGASVPGTLLQLVAANGATAQAWRLNPLADGNYTLTNLAGNANLDDPGGSNTAGQRLQLWPANNATPQEWRLTRH